MRRWFTLRCRYRDHTITTPEFKFCHKNQAQKFVRFVDWLYCPICGRHLEWFILSKKEKSGTIFLVDEKNESL
jgi:hypothetical protein